ncbi:MAG TPA: RNA-binding protein [Xanthobacteraceae bacterium]|jgi:predicted RNA-binding protein YlxR (DUF448 family)
MLALTHREALDTGPRKTAPATERFCAATGEVKPVDAMIRFVLDPDGAAVPDLRRRLPGRGVWITATRNALSTAIARKVFARAFKTEVRLEGDLVATTERLLEQAALDALAISHKAGKVAIGFATVGAALARDRVRALINAAEAAPDGTRKLLVALRRRHDAGEIAVIDVFASAQLDLALGRPNVIHAALLAGPDSETFLARTARFDGFRSGAAPGLPGIGQDRNRRSASSGLRRDSTTKHGETPEN